MAGRLLTDFLQLPIYLDMVGTAVAALALGPWRGVAIGVLTNYIGHLIDPNASLAFGFVSVVGALMWGYGVRRLGSSMPRFFSLNVLTAIACSVVAVPIVLAVNGSDFRVGHDSVVGNLTTLGNGLVVAVGLGNLTTSLLDKLLGGFFALVFIVMLPAGFHVRFRLARTLGELKSS